MIDISTRATQIKVTVPVQLQSFIQGKAAQYGLSMSGYIKHLIIADARDADIPTFPMSKKMEKAGLKAIKEYRAGKTIAVSDVGKFFQDL